MKIQSQPDNYSCGIYSIINALLVYGDRVSRVEVKELTGTTSRKGTDTKGIQEALISLGYKYRVYKTNNRNNAWRWILRNSINKPLIIYLDNNHWSVVSGRIKNKIILLNPTEILDKEELLRRWKPHWGMVVYY